MSYQKTVKQQNHFRISTFLKDVIGRDLVTNEFVAVFELVKNSLDALASRVDIAFDLDSDTLWIVDNGSGMSPNDLREKWLWVAHSAKREESVRRNYRDSIDPYPRYAGSKGIGRFSADTLGKELSLYTRATGYSKVECININWSAFEADSKKEFQGVPIDIITQAQFPDLHNLNIALNTGTILEIRGLRHSWEGASISRLRAYLEKLIDPFGTSENVPIVLSATGGDLSTAQSAELSGPVANGVAKVLHDKTTRLHFRVSQGFIESTLIDRGLEVFRIKEPVELEYLQNVSVDAELFYLNRSAKQTFSSKMKVSTWAFGSIFLFLNGFRVFPIGEPDDDYFGISRRKQQGTSRYLGTRDVMGRVDVKAPPGVLKEASSRDAGLIEDSASEELRELLVNKAIRRLERYVVDVNWKDKLDTDRDNPSGLRSEATRARIIGVVQAIVGRDNIELISYNPEIIDVLDERARGFEKAMIGLIKVAEARGDKELLKRVEAARARQSELERMEREARESLEVAQTATEEARRDARAAQAARDSAVAKLEIAERQALILDRTGSRDVADLEVFHHQARTYAAEAASIGRRAIRNIEAASNALSEQDAEDHISSKLNDASRLVSDLLLYLSRIEMIGGLAIQAAFSLNSGRTNADVVAFLDDYVEKVLPSSGQPGYAHFDGGNLSHCTVFDPIGLALVVDNLVSNSRKAGATAIYMKAVKLDAKSQDVVIEVWDEGGDGLGAADPEKIFDKGYTTRRRGTGLGLYHSRQAMEAMGGGLSLSSKRDENQARFSILLPARIKRKKF